MNPIQWYPGHMAKARREAKEKLALVDVVIELLDARIPYSSRNPVIQEIIGNKPSVIVLNKSDLADPMQTKAWIQAFNRDGQLAIDVDAQHNKGLKSLQSKLKGVMQDYFDQQALKGVKPRSIRLMILGIPNVGKSTLINRFVGKNQAITGNHPGVTKAQRWLKIDKDFDLLDTPGILWPKFEAPQVGLHLAITGAIKDDLLAMDDLALGLIRQMKTFYLDRLAEYAKVDITTSLELSDVDFLLTLSQRWGYKEDYDRAAKRLILDFRQKKMGRITLDQAEVNSQNVSITK